MVAGLVLLFAPLRSSASTFVLMNEVELTQRSVAVVRAWVRVVEGREQEGRIYTYVTLEPDEVLAGELPAGDLVLRESGGFAAGRQERLIGSPEYAVDSPVIAFLQQNGDGTLRTTGMALGLYSLDRGPNGEIRVVRRIGSEVTLLDPATGELVPAHAEESQSLAELSLRVRETETRAPRLTIVAIPEGYVPGPRVAGSAFTFLGDAFRWFEPDTRQPIRFFVEAAGDAKLGPGLSRFAVATALAAWSDVDTASVSLVDAGSLLKVEPFDGCPTQNQIVFNDPFVEIDDPIDCKGVLALGGFCTSSESRDVNGKNFQRITRGKVTFGNGWEKCALWTPCNLAEIAAHEIGHTIGLGHSENRDSIMTPRTHFDGRCASLGQDDIDAVNFLYPLELVVSVTTTPTPTRTMTSIPPTATRTHTATIPPTAPPTSTANPVETEPEVQPTSTPRNSSSSTPTESPAASTPTPRKTDIPSLPANVRLGSPRRLADGSIRVRVYLDDPESVRSLRMTLSYDQTALRPRAVRRMKAGAGSSAQAWITEPGVMEVRFASKRDTPRIEAGHAVLALVFEPRGRTAGRVEVRAAAVEHR